MAEESRFLNLRIVGCYLYRLFGELPRSHAYVGNKSGGFLVSWLRRDRHGLNNGLHPRGGGRRKVSGEGDPAILVHFHDCASPSRPACEIKRTIKSVSRSAASRDWCLRAGRARSEKIFCSTASLTARTTRQGIPLRIAARAIE